MRRSARAVADWLFAPGDPRRLASLRIGLCTVLAIRLFRGVYAGLAGQPPVLFRPRSFMQLMPAMPGRPAVVALQALGIGAAVLSALGLGSRVALPIAWGCTVFLGGMTTSLGKVMHNDVLLLLAMVPLLAAPVDDAWSVRARLTRRSAPALSSRYGWPVRTASVVVAGTYFLTGLAKIEFSGPAWFASDNLRFALYASSDAQSVPNAFGLFVADRPLLAHLLAAGVLGLELAFPAVLWKPSWAWAFVVAAGAVHLGILATMHLNYWPWIATDAVVLVDWPHVAERSAAARWRPAVSAHARGSPTL
jgi:hypothetical protein